MFGCLRLVSVSNVAWLNAATELILEKSGFLSLPPASCFGKYFLVSFISPLPIVTEVTWISLLGGLVLAAQREAGRPHESHIHGTRIWKHCPRRVHPDLSQAQQELQPD